MSEVEQVRFKLSLPGGKQNLHIEVEAGESFLKHAIRAPLMRVAHAMSDAGSVDEVTDDELLILKDLLMIEGFDQVVITKERTAA